MARSFVGRCALAAVLSGSVIMNPAMAREGTTRTAWDAPDRAARVAALIPGRAITALTRETLFADWTRQQVAAWEEKHPSSLSPGERYDLYAKTPPADADLLADFPRHIAPLARVRSGTPSVAGAADGALISYCPFCRSQAFSLAYDPKNEYRATTVCCRTELYGRASDCPPGYALRATETRTYRHLDDTAVAVPCVVYTDRDGVVWELFIKTLFDQRRWLDVGGERIARFCDEFKKTGNPVYAHKIAVLLDAVADTYYGLPLVNRNEIRELGRVEWEASPRPNVFAVGPLGPWNRRVPNFNRGWLNMGGEHIWAEPFALVRHHPAFKDVSRKRYGDPDALDRKVTRQVMRELCLTFQSVFSQKLQTNYQDAIYTNLILTGVLGGDELLTRLFLPAHETVLYNHTYRDGLNGEGAPNYMAMPGSYFLPYLAKPDGWLRFQPDFSDRHPFHAAASSEFRKLDTARSMSIEFGDQHIAAWPVYGLPGPADKAEREKRGSRNWADYGVGILRVGGPGRRLELSMDYTRASLHNAQDALSIECWVDGVPVMRRGGYCCWWWSPQFDWERPEFKALAAMNFPRRIFSADNRQPSWSWDYTHSAACQNAPTVDGVGTGLGWGGDDRGYGEVVTFKGGEAAGEPGAGFQILDVRDRHAWARVGKKDVTDFRRTLIAAETRDGRPYALDILTVRGGGEHALFNSAWGERAAAVLPGVAATAGNLEEVLPGGGPHRGTDASYFRRIGRVSRHEAPGRAWEVTWAADLAAYAPRKADGTFVRPIPEDDGRVRLRLIGLEREAGRTALISAKGPWIARLMQPLPEGRKTDGYVAFEDARDFIVERRGPAPGGASKPLSSVFVHVLEGFREGEAPVVASAALPNVRSVRGAPRETVAVALRMADGTEDTVLYQSAPGVVRLPDGTETDARYALVRRNAAGAVVTVETCRGTFVRGRGLDHRFPGDAAGEIVDIVGDITGTRNESALIVKTDRPWPDGGALRGRQLLVAFESGLREPSNEGYRVEKTTNLPGGLVRVDLEDRAPFIESWHDVFDLPAGKPGAVRTVRPLSKHSNSPWYDGLAAWFPERGRAYTIAASEPMGGGHGGVTVEFAGRPDLAKDGIRPGDWFVVHGIRPGLSVDVASSWRMDAPR